MNFFRQFEAEIFNSDLSAWKSIEKTIVPLEQEAFGDNAFPEEQITADFLNKKNIIVLLKTKGSHGVIGYVYALPIEDAESSRANEKGETAYVWNMVISKEYRGQHLAGVLMGRLEEELKGKGYKYIDICAVTANNFAENISKTYKERIVKSEPIDSKWGPQVYFRIKL